MSSCIGIYTVVDLKYECKTWVVGTICVIRQGNENLN
jgi:hypothetical protein